MKGLEGKIIDNGKYVMGKPEEFFIYDWVVENIGEDTVKIDFSYIDPDRGLHAIVNKTIILKR